MGRERKLLENLIKAFNENTIAENKFRAEPSDKTFDDKVKTERKLMLEIQRAEEFLSK